MRFWDQQHTARVETRRLLLGFALAVLVLLVAVHASLLLAWWLMGLLLPVRLPFPAGFLLTNVGVSLFLVLGGWWVETSNLRAGGVKLAKRVGARELRPSLSHAEQRLSNVVQELCIAAQMPVPSIMVLPRASAINGFAAGWDEADAVLAVTQGALDHLTREEMQGLVAHELSHLREGDTRLKMRLAGMVYGLELVYNFGDEIRERGGLAWWFGSAGMLAGLAGWITGQILKASVSRQREHLADARAVQWTRSQNGLGGVLRKVMAQHRSAALGPQDARHTGLDHPSVQHMLLVETDMVGPVGQFLSERVAERLHSHPSLEERVERVYGYPMPPLPLTPVKEPIEKPYREAHGKPCAAPDADKHANADAGAPSLASQVDPFARWM